MRKTASTLTARESEILALLSKGYMYKEIASLLSISLDTVKKHCKNVYRKLEVRNRTEASIKFNSKKTA